MPEELEFTIPQSLMNKVDISDVYRNYNNRGTPTSFGIDLNFFELGLSKSIKSSDFYLLRGKIESTLQSWEKIYQRHIDTLYKEDRSTSVDGMNEELQSTINILNNILSHTLEVDDTVDWDILKRNDAFRIISGDLFDGIDKPDYIEFNSYGRPVNFQKLPIPRQPSFEHIKNSYGFFTKTFRTSVIQKDYEKRVSKWKSYREQVEEDNKQREELYNKITAIYKIKKEEFKKERKHDNDTIEAFKLRYENADPEAIEEYSDLVLSNSTYPDLFPRNWTLEYRPENHMIVVDYDLPSPDHLPEVESYRYIKSRDEISEKKLTDTTRKKLYDSVIYQICIRTIHELFEADITNAIETAAFNGIVTHINPATGQKETKVIISVSKRFHNLIGGWYFFFFASARFPSSEGVPIMSRHRSELTDAQWAHIAPLLPEPKASPNGGPKPIANRPVFEGILWVLRSGARWKDLPAGYPSPSTCWRRLRAWEEQDIWLKAWRALLGQLDEQGQLDWAETFADGSFAPAKKGGPAWAKPNVERVRSGWWWQTAKVFLWETTWTRRPRPKSG